MMIFCLDAKSTTKSRAISCYCSFHCLSLPYIYSIFMMGNLCVLSVFSYQNPKSHRQRRRWGCDDVRKENDQRTRAPHCCSVCSHFNCFCFHFTMISHRKFIPLTDGFFYLFASISFTVPFAISFLLDGRPISSSFVARSLLLYITFVTIYFAYIIWYGAIWKTAIILTTSVR